MSAESACVVAALVFALFAIYFHFRTEADRDKATALQLAENRIKMEEAIREAVVQGLLLAEARIQGAHARSTAAIMEQMMGRHSGTK